MNLIVGIDEVGRGCWAGPLVAGAVLLHEPINGLKDSKLLSKKQREKLALQIESSAACGLGWIWPEEIDQIGLTAAIGKAMSAALSQILDTYDQVIIDGNYNYLPENNKAITMIKADLTVPAASAASILAKVARDNYMADQSLKYPDYGFEKHVGYGTAAHIAALQEFGICELHRQTYKPIKEFLT